MGCVPVVRLERNPRGPRRAGSVSSGEPRPPSQTFPREFARGPRGPARGSPGAVSRSAFSKHVVRSTGEPVQGRAATTGKRGPAGILVGAVECNEAGCFRVSLSVPSVDLARLTIAEPRLPKASAC